MKSKLTINGLGTKIWRLPNGDYHREDGPAIEYSDGSKSWFINGKLYTERMVVWCRSGLEARTFE